jgi:uncharacterized protein
VPVIPAACALGSLLILALPAAEEWAIPPVPERHFSDRTSTIAADVAQRIDDRLARYKQETTNQFLVAVFGKVPWVPVEEFTLATAKAWGVGQKHKDNGVVLFVFVEDRRMRIEVGRGLERSLTDALAQRILDEVITPRFRAGDMGGGLDAGVDAVITVLSGRPLPMASPRPSPH